MECPCRRRPSDLSTGDHFPPVPSAQPNDGRPEAAVALGSKKRTWPHPTQSGQEARRRCLLPPLIGLRLDTDSSPRCLWRLLRPLLDICSPSSFPEADIPTGRARPETGASGLCSTGWCKRRCKRARPQQSPRESGVVSRARHHLHLKDLYYQSATALRQNINRHLVIS